MFSQQGVIVPPGALHIDPPEAVQVDVIVYLIEFYLLCMTC